MTDDGREQPALDRHRHADVRVLVAQHAGVGPRGVGRGHLLQRQRQRLDDEVVDGQLVGARPVLGRGAVHALARPQQLVEAAVDAQVEVRDGLLRLRQPLRNDPAHAVVRHDLVGALLVKREDLVVGHRLRRERRRRLGGAAPSPSPRCRRERRWPPSFSAASTSRLMMRPCGPEPASAARSRLPSLASRRASGEAKMRLTRHGRWAAADAAGSAAAGRAARCALAVAGRCRAVADAALAAGAAGPLLTACARCLGRRRRTRALALCQQHRDRRVDLHLVGAFRRPAACRPCPRRRPPPPWWPCRSRSRR